MTITLLQGDCREVLAGLPPESVQCCVTSPPYWGLRDYGVAGQIGLEKSPAEYVEKLVAVFREVRRVLRADGTCWVNLGDCYATGTTASRRPTGIEGAAVPASWSNRCQGQRAGTPDGLKTKDLVGIPWRVAFALQADGWWLRSDIIWSKPNPMPESVQDRPTSAHEHVFLFAKAERYFYDADMIREPAVGTELGDIDGGPQRLSDGSNANPGRNYRQPNSPQSIASPHGQGFTRRAKGNAKTFRGGVYTGGKAFDNSASMRRDSTGNAPNETFSRNARNVWTIATRPFPEAHFATFPPELAERCIRAGSREGDTVLDPFGGAGTTGLAADRLGRHATLIELSADYIAIARRRLQAERRQVQQAFEETGLIAFGQLWGPRERRQRDPDESISRQVFRQRLGELLFHRLRLEPFSRGHKSSFRL